MQNERLIMKWWFWVSLIPISIGVFSFIVAMTYALHPTEIRLFANDQMVATAQGLTKQLTDDKFNECLAVCKPIDTDNAFDCYQSCWGYYYGENVTSNSGCKFLESFHDSCLDKYTQKVADIQQCKDALAQKG